MTASWGGGWLGAGGIEQEGKRTHGIAGGREYEETKW